MTSLADHVRTAVRATEITSATTFTWFGRPNTPLPPGVAAGLGGDGRCTYLQRSLTARLYQDFYTAGTAVPYRYSARSGPAESPAAFIDRLRRANLSRGRWADLRLVRLRPGGAEVRYGNLDVTMTTIGDPDGMVRAFLGGESLTSSPGFYFVHGGVARPAMGTSARVRWYWNLAAMGAPLLVSRITDEFGDAGMCFAVKVVANPSGYDRCDAGVLYVEGPDAASAARLVSKIFDEVAPLLRDGTPAFTRVDGVGLGFAEQPPGSESFGMNRCRLVAEGLIAAYEQDLRSEQDRVDAVLTQFDTAGIDLSRPYLNPHSADVPVVRMTVLKERRTDAVAWQRPSPDDLLGAAHRVALQLKADALWAGDECTWLGAGPRIPGPAGPVLQTLGGAVYDGTAGIGLFLAECASRTGDVALRHMARGAVNHAIEHVDRGRCGFHTGSPGVAVVAAHVGALLDEPELVDQALSELRALDMVARPDEEPDLLAGTAGGIVAALIGYQMCGDDKLVAAAVIRGDHLISTAHRSEGGWSWASPSAAPGRQGNLLGLSHGTAGIAHALMALWSATRESRFRAAAEHALCYERAKFDDRVGNWPDLRDPVRMGWVTPGPGFMTASCCND